MSVTIDLAGRKFGRLVVIGKATNCKRFSWKCICACGTATIVRSDSLKSGHTKSCGCLQKELVKKRSTIHGMHLSCEYRTWVGMYQRCTNKKSIGYCWYGSKGITVCNEWKSFEVFLKDMGKKPKGLTIERINNEKGYSPQNCKWGTKTEQSRNQGICNTNKTGTRGISWKPCYNKYHAYIGVNYKQIHLGYFYFLQDAIDARRQGEMEYWNIQK